MKQQTLAALVLVGALGMAGCGGWTPHELDLTADAPDPVMQDLGDGVRLAVLVIDDREQRVVGKPGVGTAGVNISPRQLITYFRQQIVQGFRARGFALLPEGDPVDAQVVVSLRSFQWNIQMGFWLGTENVFVSIKAQARSVSTADEIVRTYHYDETGEPVTITADGNEINERMNAGVSSVLAQLFADGDLMRFVTSAASARRE